MKAVMRRSISRVTRKTVKNEEKNLWFGSSYGYLAGGSNLTYVMAGDLGSRPICTGGVIG